MRFTTLVTLAAVQSLLLAGCCCPRPCCPPPCCPQPCGPTPAGLIPAAPAGAPAPASGGLLGDTAAFRENPERRGTWTWTKPGADLRSYDDLLIEEVRAQPAPGSAFEALPEAERAAATAAFRAALVSTVTPYYDVVEAPGAHTLRVRVALVSLPAADGGGAASLEAELLDGLTQQRLVAALGALSVEELKAPAGSEAASPAERAQRAWAARLLRYLDTHVR